MPNIFRLAGENRILMLIATVQMTMECETNEKYSPVPISKRKSAVNSILGNKNS